MRERRHDPELSRANRVPPTLIISRKSRIPAHVSLAQKLTEVIVGKLSHASSSSSSSTRILLLWLLLFCSYLWRCCTFVVGWTHHSPPSQPDRRHHHHHPPLWKPPSSSLLYQSSRPPKLRNNKRSSAVGELYNMINDDDEALYYYNNSTTTTTTAAMELATTSLGTSTNDSRSSSRNNNTDETTMQHRLYDIVADLQLEFGRDAVMIVRDDDDDDEEETEEEAIDVVVDDYDDVRVASIEEEDFTLRPTINSLVFVTTSTLGGSNPKGYILVILRETRRVNVTALEETIQRQQLEFIKNNNNSTTTVVTVELAPSEQVQNLCGFVPGTVPPIGLYPEPICTVLDESLVTLALQQPQTLLRGGGGQIDSTCLVSIDVLLQQSPLVVAPISMEHRSSSVFGTNSIDEIEEDVDMDDIMNQPLNCEDASGASIETVAVNRIDLDHPMPYFAVAPPIDADVYRKLQIDNDDNTNENEILDTATTLQPVSVSFVGRIARVRRMARTLAFCDVIPPDNNYWLNGYSDDDIAGTTSSRDDLAAWRNPRDDEPMAVQLIAGKTLCQTTGGDEALRRLQRGQLLLVQGRTNVGNRESLRNWVTQRSFDIVLRSYQVLREDPILTTKKSSSGVGSTVLRPNERQQRGYPPPSPPIDPEKCLRLKDLYDGCEIVYINSDDKIAQSSDSPVVLVDTMQSVKRFSKDLSHLLTSLQSPKRNDGEGTSTQQQQHLPIGLVGVDCEWQPTFLLPSSRDPQPVLLLQICLHPLKRIYLFDLQTLLRPMMPPSQSMDKLEREVSSALGALFESKRLIKVGFQVVHDLRQCAASYPHIPTLQFYNAVLEASTLGKKAIRMTGSGDARIASSSLSRLVDHFLGKPVNKMEQCSEWSRRPLSVEQIEYAALDAAVTPIMVERMIQDLDIRFFCEKPQLGRWENDVSYKKVITSWRFVFVSTTDFEVQRKLKAKRIVGDPLVVSQSWTTGDVPPRIPTLPENGLDGPYTDVWGLTQVPSALVAIRSNRIDDIIDSMIGERVGKSKDKCVEAFLRRPDVIPAGARLDYPQRSGFVEFRDGVALFVNMPTTPGGRFQPRSYPNEWLEEGKILTWFLRENDWKQGKSTLAQKLVSSNTVVTLFVRIGSTGAFLCCGRCRVEDPSTAGVVNGEGSSGLFRSGTAATPDNWTLVKLYLVLLDWNKVRTSSDFQALAHPDSCYTQEQYEQLEP